MYTYAWRNKCSKIKKFSESKGRLHQCLLYYSFNTPVDFSKVRGRKYFSYDKHLFFLSSAFSSDLNFYSLEM